MLAIVTKYAQSGDQDKQNTYWTPVDTRQKTKNRIKRRLHQKATHGSILLVRLPTATMSTTSRLFAKSNTNYTKSHIVIVKMVAQPWRWPKLKGFHSKNTDMFKGYCKPSTNKFRIIGNVHEWTFKNDTHKVCEMLTKGNLDGIVSNKWWSYITNTCGDDGDCWHRFDHFILLRWAKIWSITRFIENHHKWGYQWHWNHGRQGEVWSGSTTQDIQC